MKILERLSKKALEFCELSGYDVNKVREDMKSNCFALKKCETKEEMIDEGVDFNYPYVIWNPYNFSINS